MVGAFESLTVADLETGGTHAMDGWVDQRCAFCEGSGTLDRQELIESLLNKGLITSSEAQELAELAHDDIVKAWREKQPPEPEGYPAEVFLHDLDLDPWEWETVEPAANEDDLEEQSEDEWDFVEATTPPFLD